MTAYSDTITDGIGSHDAQVTGYGVTLNDTFSAHDLLNVVRGQPAAVTDGVGVHDSITWLFGLTITEALQVTDKLFINQYGHLSIIEQILAHDAIAQALPVGITDGIGMTLTLATQQLIAIVEALGINDAIAATFRYGLSVSEALTFADALARFIGAGIVEGLQIVEVMTGSANMPVTVSDTALLQDDLSSSRLLLSVTVAEGIDITDGELIKMIFHDEIIEGIEAIAGYFDPSGSVTTWAMNTRTAAVTEYTNYNFNSFARMGNKYLGATSDGLYELDGDTDAGTNIIADLKSGFAQFAGVHLASFKAAYIAARGGGSFVLRVYTGDGQRYDYAVTTDSMKTARIDMGKGIRARYFAFELISSGQDFDLESLEFVPLIAKRRV